MSHQDTIVAIASPVAPAERGILRMSGDDVAEILRRGGIAVPDGQSPVRFTTTLDLGDPLSVVPVDVLWWPTRRSYTGEPAAELHTIGSPVLLMQCVRHWIAAGCRAARPGEFTMRAFLAGRLDLIQAEAVLSVIEAEDVGTLDRSLRQLAGNLSRPLSIARATLLDLIADVEAGLDFVDEDIQFITDGDLLARVTEIQTGVRQTIAQLRSRSTADAVVRVVVRGLPNAGKSRLINAMTGQDAVIVSPAAGTTRDIVRVRGQIDGHVIEWVDTAGVESRPVDDPDQPILESAQRHAAIASADADVRCWCVDAATGNLDDVAAKLREALRTHERDMPVKRSSIDLFLATKADLAVPGSLPPSDSRWHRVSSVRGDGLDGLRERLRAIADRHDPSEIGDVIGTAARCHDSLTGADAALASAITAIDEQIGHEIVAGELRLAVQSIGEVTGEIYTDDILDRVFSRFCIGK